MGHMHFATIKFFELVHSQLYGMVVGGTYRKGNQCFLKIQVHTFFAQYICFQGSNRIAYTLRK